MKYIQNYQNNPVSKRQMQSKPQSDSGASLVPVEYTAANDAVTKTKCHVARKRAKTSGEKSNEFIQKNQNKSQKGKSRNHSLITVKLWFQLCRSPSKL